MKKIWRKHAGIPENISDENLELSFAEFRRRCGKLNFEMLRKKALKFNKNFGKVNGVGKEAKKRHSSCESGDERVQKKKTKS